MRVRFRVDGVLHETARVPKRMISGVVSRVKLMSDMDIAEKRLPQDGRVSVNVDDRKIDLRVTTLPTQRGEGCSIRILDKGQAMRTLDELGWGATPGRGSRLPSTGPMARSWSRGRPAGKVDDAVRGAPGAERRGAQHHHDRGPGRVPDLGHQPAQRQPKAGLDFATGRRSILRADPDVIMVGEIRDVETARIAIEAALTGHMVLTTLHTNDAPGAVARLGSRWGSRPS